jgi:hypothetical protein
MGIAYSEFDTTPATLVSTIKAAILGSSDWTSVPVTPVSTTNTVATTAAGNTITLSSVAGIVSGQVIAIAPGTANEVQRLVLSVSGNVVTISGTWGLIYATNTTVVTRNEILRTTTSAGAPMVIDLAGNLTGVAGQANVFALLTYRQWTGNTPGGHTDLNTSYATYKSGAQLTTQPVHVTVSAGKNHVFIAIEGPRAHEAGATSTLYGSLKNYVFVAGVTPYHASDAIPCVVTGSQVTWVAASSVASNAHQVAISRDSTNSNSWTAGRLASLTMPTMYTSTDVISVNRVCTIDGKTYLLPYVLFSETEGIRGRLTSLFYANTNAPSPVGDYPDPTNGQVELNGVIYKLVPVSKSDGANQAWGPFGIVGPPGVITRTVLVAVPYAEAV